MAAILGGLGAAVAWATSTLCSSRSSRLIGAPSAVAWVSLIGLLVCAPWAAAVGAPASLDAGNLAWLLVAGAGNIGGLMLAYAAFRVGDVALAAPVVSTEGAIAAVISLVTGEGVNAATVAVLAVIAAGVWLSSLSAPPSSPGAASGARAALRYAVAAALVFGIGLYAVGHLSSRVPVAWVVLSARLVGAVTVALALALAGELRLTRRALPLVVVAAICEVAGFAVFALGARHGVAVTAVLSSQFATIAAIAGYTLFRERLGRLQLAGVVTVIVGVSVLSGLRA